MQINQEVPVLRAFANAGYRVTGVDGKVTEEPGIVGIFVGAPGGFVSLSVDEARSLASALEDFAAEAERIVDYTDDTGVEPF